MFLVKIEKLKSFFKSEYFIVPTIAILACLIRLINIDKPYGLWYDEMITYIFASKPFPLGILKALAKEDFHMPLYYLYLGGWMKLFGSSDVILRLSSVFWGVLSIPAFFFMGKVYKSKELGYWLATIACLSPIMIYYSQELRFYSMLIFFSALSIAFLIKLLDEPENKTLIMFGLSNLVILYIYTMGIIFVSLEMLVLLLHFYFYKKEVVVKFLKFLAIFLLCATPYFVILTSYLIADKNALVNPFVWFGLTPTGVLFIINDWLGHSFLGLYDNNYTKWMKLYPITKFLILMAPSCFIIGLISNLFKPNKKLLYSLFILTGFIFVEIYLCLFRDFIFLTRYTLVVLPIALLICTGGIFSIQSTRIRKTLLYIILTVFTLNLLNHGRSLSFDPRLNGLKPSAQTLLKLNINKNDYYLFPGRSELSKKYLPEVNMIDFDISGVLSLDKTKKEALKMFSKDFVAETNKSNAMQKLTIYLLSEEPTPELTDYINSEINKIPKGRRLIVLDTRTSPVKEAQRRKIILNNLENKNAYKAEFFAIIYDKIFDDVKQIVNDNGSLKKVETVIDFNKNNKVRYWQFTVYKKVK